MSIVAMRNTPPLYLAAVATLIVAIVVAQPSAAQNQSPMTPGVTGIKAFTLDLSGDAQVPGPGAEGEGTAFVIVNPNAGRICYALELSGVTPPGAAHIHEGAAEEAGDPIVDFDIANRGLGGCVTQVDPALARRIANEPENFYLNVHNEDFPQGALRGQLSLARGG